MPRPRLVVAARVVCYINGKMLGRVAGITWNSITPHKEARGVDDPTVQEFMPTTVSVGGTIIIHRLIGDGGAQGAGIAVPQALVSKEKYFVMQLIERETDTTIFSMTQGIAHGEVWQLLAKEKLQGTITFSGRTWNNELG